MADEVEEQRMSLAPREEEEEKKELVSSSESDNSDDDEGEAPQVEWLATTRAKRSTAGNRMKSMLAAEEPDDELELLFAEDGDDAGFSDDGGDSDVQMDSSSDDEDAPGHGDEDEGEKELEKQLRERKLAARKRKAQDAIPMKFRKKVRVDPTPSESSAATTVPRHRKKSERASWLPLPADAPTRASRRETTMLSKEALHQQMVEREAKRLKQVDAMERKAKRMEALKKPPMTQAERLEEAAKVEKRNAKSLNRWEEAEKLREEERKAKLAALNNRQLNGPVVTFWSGMGEWIDGKLKHLGKSVIIEDKIVKKRLSTIGTDKPSETPGQEQPVKADQEKAASTPAVPSSTTSNGDAPVHGPEPMKIGNLEDSQVTEVTEVMETTNPDLPPEECEKKPHQQPDNPPNPSTEEQNLKDPEVAQPITQNIELVAQQRSAPDAKLPESHASQTANSGMSPIAIPAAPVMEIPSVAPPSQATLLDPEISHTRPPDLQPPSASPYTTSMFAPPSQTHAPVMKPPEMRPPSNSYLAPPPGATRSGLSMPVLGYSPTAQPSNVLAAQRQSPLSMPQTNVRPPPPPPPPPPSVARNPLQTPQALPKPSVASSPKPQGPSIPPTPKALGSLKHANASKKTKEQPSIPDLPPSPRPSPPPDMKATCNSMILQNFDENAIEQKSVQQRILFGKETGKLAKQAPPPKCIITNKVARYKDPKTGLPYYDSKAYKQIQKLQKGDYKWSQLIGAWVGTASLAAQGVPARFLDANAPPPPKPTPVIKQEPGSIPKQDEPAAAAPTPSVPVQTGGDLRDTAAPSTPSTDPSAIPINPSVTGANPPATFPTPPVTAPMSSQTPAMSVPVTSTSPSLSTTAVPTTLQAEPASIAN